MKRKTRTREWTVKRLSREAVRAWSQFAGSLVKLGLITPDAAKKVDHINYIQRGDCLYIQIVYEDGSTTEIEICEEKPRETNPA